MSIIGKRVRAPWNNAYALVLACAFQQADENAGAKYVLLVQREHDGKLDEWDAIGLEIVVPEPSS